MQFLYYSPQATRRPRRFSEPPHLPADRSDVIGRRVGPGFARLLSASRAPGRVGDLERLVNLSRAVVVEDAAPRNARWLFGGEFRQR